MARTARRYRGADKEMEDSKAKSLQVGIYGRLSVDCQDGHSDSIENQIEIVHQFIRANNSKPDREMNLVIHGIYIDRGITGTSFERDGFERLMKDVMAQKVTCIIVKDLSRFGRDYMETGNLIEKVLPLWGCRFIAVTDRFDSMALNVNDSKLTMNIKNLVNDMYAKDISKRMAIARKMSAESGSFIGSFAPYGYEVVFEEGVRKLKINEECAEIVRKIYTLYAQGNNCKDIIDKLYCKKVHRISDYKKYGHVYCSGEEILHQWSGSSVWGILQNPSYLGNLEQCRLTGERVTVAKVHQAIVSDKIFEAVKKRMAGCKASHKGQYKQKDTENVYRNILYCGKCGKLMHATYYSSRVTGQRHYAYHCRSAYFLDGRKCEKNYVREEQVTGLMAKQLQSVFSGQKIDANDLIKLNMEEFECKVEVYRMEEKKIHKEGESGKKKAGTVYGQFKEGAITKEEYEDFRRNKKEQDDHAVKKLKDIKRKMEKAKYRAEEENQFLRSLFKVGECQQLNVRFVEALIEKIAIFPDGIVDIVYKFGTGGM